MIVLISPINLDGAYLSLDATIMSAPLTLLKLLRVRKKRTPCENRQISSVHLPTELWLWIRRFLAKKDLHRLSRVCFIFRNILQPYLPFRVCINCKAQPRRLRQRLSALVEYPSLLPRISEIKVEMIRPPVASIKLLVLNPRITLIISAFLQNVSHMPRLHTACFSWVQVKQEHLALLFKSNSLHHLSLFQCYLPKSLRRLPPSPIRYLTLSLRDDHKHMEPLLGHCSTNLEALDFTGQVWQAQGSMEPPPFPKLQKMKFTVTSGPVSHLDTLSSLAPQLEHLEVWLQGYSFSGLSALPARLNHLRLNQWLIEYGDFGTRPFVHLRHLHITYYVYVEGNDSVIAIIRRIFPNLTSLHVEIHYSFRNIVLLLARTLPNVTQLKLSIDRLPLSMLCNDDATSYIADTPGGRLARLYVNVLGSQQRDMELYKSWVIYTILEPGQGLGGPHLQEVEVAFLPKSTPPLLTSSIPRLPLWCWKRVKKEWIFNRY